MTKHSTSLVEYKPLWGSLFPLHDETWTRWEGGSNGNDLYEKIYLMSAGIHRAFFVCNFCLLRKNSFL